jgi:hypothetical protein
MTTPESPERLAPLRGAGVQIDARRAGRVVALAGLATLAVLVVVFFVVGIEKISQINRFHHHGVNVTFTVSGCLGLLGGSGSNVAGYSCRGSFTIGGHRYDEPIPGSTFYRPGTTLRAITVPGDPALVAPSAMVAGEHTSMTVFILPAVFLGVLLLVVGAVLLHRRHRPGPEIA